MTFLPRPPLAGAFHVNCRLPVIDSQKFCGLICSRERGYSRCRRLRTVLDLAPACLAGIGWGFFYAELMVCKDRLHSVSRGAL
jgi:hypothetical protein